MKASLLARAAPALLLSTVLAGGMATAGFAQTAPSTSAPAAGAPASGAASASTAAPASSMPMVHSGAHHTTHAMAAGQTMQAMVERRITQLHTQLHITSAQQSQWDQFAQVMRDNAKDLDAAYQQRAEKLDSMSAVDNMQSYASIEQTRAQDVQKLVPAFQSLYASLSEAQKQDADAVFRNQAAAAEAHHHAAVTKAK
jgi:hypothetical protein